MEHKWRVKRPVLHLFDRGKELEVRVRGRLFERVRPGDLIIFNEEVRRKVLAVRYYRSFDAVLKREDAGRILPGHSASDTLALLRAIYPPERERQGVYVFELTREAAK